MILLEIVVDEEQFQKNTSRRFDTAEDLINGFGKALETRDGFIEDYGYSLRSIDATEAKKAYDITLLKEEL